MDQSLSIDDGLIRRYDKSGPRYTSYPTADRFHAGFTADDYRACAAATHDEPALRPLSLYFHIPFCDTLCFYCACNKIATKNRAHAVPYLEALHREIALQAGLFDRSRTVDQLHWGGGTPTFISHEQMRALMQATREHFTLRDDDSGEYSIEIDPREVKTDTIRLLRELGFNRMSMGVQDFDTVVQRAVNRLQGEAETFAVLDQARAAGFHSVSIDLIYGLPFQNRQGFMATLDKVIAAGPDRLSVFNYAHLPERFAPQRRIRAEDLPQPAEKLAILHATIDRLTAAGYVYIGMDHFARPDDELAVAQRERTLYRNFQGYSTHADCDLVGLGVTSIGMVGDCYAQNVKELDEYQRLLAEGRLPVYRGIRLDADDRLRREVITRLICHFELDMRAIEREFAIDFAGYFAAELRDLAAMQADGLLDIGADVITVHPVGHLLIRNVCMVFDRYLRGSGERRYSKVI
ncbi:MAG: oxygen-independent coproporphyrinogen III oxidase [Gammaproteobacteria bacterium]|nr:oxygen-independent coproporphyrinogen III oxidase [Gammaproteobacteria bacterium]